MRGFTVIHAYANEAITTDPSKNEHYPSPTHLALSSSAADRNKKASVIAYPDILASATPRFPPEEICFLPPPPRPWLFTCPCRGAWSRLGTFFSSGRWLTRRWTLDRMSVETHSTLGGSNCKPFTQDPPIPARDRHRSIRYTHCLSPRRRVKSRVKHSPGCRAARRCESPRTSSRLDSPREKAQLGFQDDVRLARGDMDHPQRWC